MKPERDYQLERASGTVILARPPTEGFAYDDPVPRQDDSAALKAQLKADKDHPAHGLDKVADEAD